MTTEHTVTTPSHTSLLIFYIVDAILIVWTLITFLTLILVNNKLYIQLIGYASVMTEVTSNFVGLINVNSKGVVGLPTVPFKLEK